MTKNRQSLHNFFMQYYPFILLPLISLLAYSNSFQVPFQFDDNRNIVNNPLIRSFRYFIFPDEAKPFPGYRDFIMRYMGFLTFALNYRIHELNVIGYHIFNLLIHILNTFAVYYLVLLTAKTPIIQEYITKGKFIVAPQRFFLSLAEISAGLFAVHPIQTQAVTYIVQRFASLATMFYLLALLTYIRWRLSPNRKGFYVVALFLTLSAMKTKEIAFSLPLAILFYECLFFRASSARRILIILPFGIIGLVIPLSYLYTAAGDENLIQQVFTQSKVLTDMPRSAYLFTEMRVIVTYLRLLVFPAYQNFDYDYPIFYHFSQIQVWLSLSFILLLIFTAFYLQRRSTSGDIRFRLISFGILWFFLTLLPESGLIPIVDVIYEHRLYLPSVGAFIAVAASIFLLMEHFIKSAVRIIKFHFIVMLIIISVLAWATFQRNRIWQEEVTLWEDVVKKSPAKVRALTNLGAAYLEKGRLDQALDVFQKAVAIEPNNDVVYTNIATVYFKQSFLYRDQYQFAKAAELLDKSIQIYQKLIKLNPQSSYLQTYLDQAVQERSRYILKNPNQ